MRKALSLDNLFYEETTLNTGFQVLNKITWNYFQFSRSIMILLPWPYSSECFLILLSSKLLPIKIKLRETFGNSLQPLHSNIATALIWTPSNLSDLLTDSWQVLHPQTFPQTSVQCYKVCNIYPQCYSAKWYSNRLKAVTTQSTAQIQKEMCQVIPVCLYTIFSR